MESEWTVVTKSDKRRVARRGNAGTPRRGDVHDDRAASHQPRNSRGRRPSGPSSNSDEKQEKKLWDEKEKNKILSDLLACKTDFPRSDLYQNLTKEWEQMTNSGHFVSLVCYGIGNFSSSKRCAPMWQLACALCLRDDILGTVDRRRNPDSAMPIEMLYFDPCTTALEATILEDLGITMIDANEQGRRSVEGKRTVFFMPHCPMMLYVNVLVQNWDVLSNNQLVIVGNSLHAYDSNRFPRKSPESLLILLPFLEEASLSITRKDMDYFPGNFEGAFNDTYLSWFPSRTGGVDWPQRPISSTTADDDDEVIFGRNFRPHHLPVHE